MDSLRAELEQTWREWIGSEVPGLANGVEAMSLRAERLDEASILSALPEVERTKARARLERITDGGRRKEWLVARGLEHTLRERLGSDVLISVSHNRNAVVVVGAAARGAILGVGVDLEQNTREVDPRIGARLWSDSEKNVAPALSLLDAWVIKEACFKSAPSNAELVISQFVVSSFDEKTGSGEAQGPRGLCRFRLSRMNSWIVGFALHLSPFVDKSCG